MCGKLAHKNKHVCQPKRASSGSPEVEQGLAANFAESLKKAHYAQSAAEATAAAASSLLGADNTARGGFGLGALLEAKVESAKNKQKAKGEKKLRKKIESIYDKNSEEVKNLHKKNEEHSQYSIRAVLEAVALFQGADSATPRQSYITPPVAQTPTPTPALEDRLARLKKLFTGGYINEEQYNSQVGALLTKSFACDV
jgi:hypothetical protein